MRHSFKNHFWLLVSKYSQCLNTKLVRSSDRWLSSTPTFSEIGWLSDFRTRKSRTKLGLVHRDCSDQLRLVEKPNKLSEIWIPFCSGFGRSVFRHSLYYSFTFRFIFDCNITFLSSLLFCYFFPSCGFPWNWLYTF